MEDQSDTSNFLEFQLKLHSSNTTYGFHLIRTSWDPYPRVEKVEEDTVALQSGIQIGDFVIRINDNCLLGVSIQCILNIVKEAKDELKLNIWRPGLENPNHNVINSVLGLLGCPVCATSVASQPRQCRNGHVICTPCVVRTDKCPMCRAPLGRPANDARALPGARCLIAEQLTAALHTAGFVVMCNANTNRKEDNSDAETSCGEQHANDKIRSSFASKLAEFWKVNKIGHHRHA